MTLICILVVLLTSVSHAMAHGVPSASIAHWNSDPWVLTPILVSGTLYSLGVLRLWRHAGRGRGVRRWQVLCFAGGWASLVFALLSPLDELAGGLFLAHMIEHEIVMVVAAPLIAVARPWAAMLWALPPNARRWFGSATQSISRSAAWRVVSTPVAATVIHGIALWLWHAPALYNTVLVSDTMHRLQHLSFFATALLFWWSIVNARRANYGSAIACLFITMMHGGFLGMLLMFSRTVWYPNQGAYAAELGLTALEDQQLAGLIMWLPPGIVYATVAIVLAARWINAAASRPRPLLNAGPQPDLRN